MAPRGRSRDEDVQTTAHVAPRTACGAHRARVARVTGSEESETPSPFSDAPLGNGETPPPRPSQPVDRLSDQAPPPGLGENRKSESRDRHRRAAVARHALIVLLCSALPCRALLCLALLCFAAPYFALPCLAVPCLARRRAAPRRAALPIWVPEVLLELFTPSALMPREMGVVRDTSAEQATPSAWCWCQTGLIRSIPIQEIDPFEKQKGQDSPKRKGEVEKRG